MLKTYMLHFGIIPTSEFLYLATDATKAIVHMVNVKLK